MLPGSNQQGKNGFDTGFMQAVASMKLEPCMELGYQCKVPFQSVSRNHFLGEHNVLPTVGPLWRGKLSVDDMGKEFVEQDTRKVIHLGTHWVLG